MSNLTSDTWFGELDWVQNDIAAPISTALEDMGATQTSSSAEPQSRTLHFEYEGCVVEVIIRPKA